VEGRPKGNIQLFHPMWCGKFPKSLQDLYPTLGRSARADDSGSTELFSALAMRLSIANECPL
jgi:hypothetical protein